MTTDHSEAVHFLRFSAAALGSGYGAGKYGAAADALEALTTERTITINDTAVDAAARWLAGLNADDAWPTNEELGGNHFTGDRDIEFQEGKREDARHLLEAAYAAQNPEGDPQ